MPDCPVSVRQRPRDSDRATPKCPTLLFGLAIVFSACQPIVVVPVADATAPPDSGDSSGSEPGALDASTAGTRVLGPPKAPSIELADLLKIPAYWGYAFAHDGQSYFYSTNRSGVFNVHEVELATGRTTQLTHSNSSPIRMVSSFPKDERILIQSDGEGDELYRLFVLKADGQKHDLIEKSGARSSFHRFTRDGSAFFVSTNERDPRYMDLYRYSSESYARRRIFDNEQGYTISLVDGTGRRLVVAKTNDNFDTDIQLIDLQSRERRPRSITASSVVAHESALTFSVDDSELHYTSDRDHEYKRWWAYDLARRSHRVVRDADWDVVSVKFSASGKLYALRVNQRAREVGSIHRVADHSQLELPPLGKGAQLSLAVLAPEDRGAALWAGGDATPFEYSWWPWQGEANPKTETVAMTANLPAAVDGSLFVEGEHLEFPSFDGRMIPGILYRPRNASAQSPVPLLIGVHGGPGGQSKHGFDGLSQAYADRGYAVFWINNRGSEGYGKSFFHLDDQRHGEVDLEDCVYAKHYLANLDWVDENRVGIMGGSYGGYMTVAALAYRPTTFKVGINEFGVVNWPRTLLDVPTWWAPTTAATYQELGHPELDVARLLRISPLFFVDQIRAPLLVLQGANDPRVRQSESDELVERMRAAGKQVQYELFEDEGHGFYKRENLMRRYLAHFNFLARHL